MIGGAGMKRYLAAVFAATTVFFAPENNWMERKYGHFEIQLHSLEGK
jgi:PDZ domain-containing secreted protein